jgi:hypothetical protein
VLVGLIADAVDDRALLGQCRVLLDVVGLRVQVGHALGDHDALGVGPGTRADAVLGVDRRLIARRRRAQVCAPRSVTRSRRRCQRLAVLVGTGQPAKVGAVARPAAGDEERHLITLRRRAERAERDDGDERHDAGDARNQLAHECSFVGRSCYASPGYFRAAFE